MVDLTVSVETTRRSPQQSASKQSDVVTKSFQHKLVDHDSFRKYKSSMTSSTQISATGNTMSLKQRNSKNAASETKKSLPPKKPVQTAPSSIHKEKEKLPPQILTQKTTPNQSFFFNPSEGNSERDCIKKCKSNFQLYSEKTTARNSPKNVFIGGRKFKAENAT